MKLFKIMKDRRGNSTPLTIALILGLLLLICALSEFFRLGIIVSGVRDGLQQAVITVATTNYDEAYNGLREGYSGDISCPAKSGRRTLITMMYITGSTICWEPRKSEGITSRRTKAAMSTAFLGFRWILQTHP